MTRRYTRSDDSYDPAPRRSRSRNRGSLYHVRRYRDDSCLERLLRALVTGALVVLLGFVLTHLPQTIQFVMALFSAISFLISIFPLLLRIAGILAGVFAVLAVLYGGVRLWTAISRSLSRAALERAQAAALKARAKQERIKSQHSSVQVQREQVRLAREVRATNHEPVASAQRQRLPAPPPQPHRTRTLTRPIDDSPQPQQPPPSPSPTASQPVRRTEPMQQPPVAPLVPQSPAADPPLAPRRHYGSKGLHRQRVEPFIIGQPMTGPTSPAGPLPALPPLTTGQEEARRIALATWQETVYLSEQPEPVTPPQRGLATQGGPQQGAAAHQQQPGPSPVSSTTGELSLSNSGIFTLLVQARSGSRKK